MPEATSYRLHGISRLDMLRFSGDPEITFEPEPVPRGTYGEPATFVMVATIAGIAAFAAYLLKDRRKDQGYIEIEECRPDGSKTTKKIIFQSSEEVAGKEISQIIKQIKGTS